jgi:ankyrin repeat protein
MQAAARGDQSEVQRLIDSGADVNAHQRRTFRIGVCFITACPDTSVPVGATPLMFAVDAQSIAATRALLNAGARIDAHNEVGEDAIDRAVQHLSTDSGRDVFRLLLDRRAGAMRPSAANTALFESSRYGLLDIVRETVPLVRDNLQVELAMCQAATGGHLDVLDVLRVHLGRLPPRLVSCVGQINLATLTYLLEHGIEANQRHEGGNTLLERLVAGMRGTFYETCDCRQLEPLYMVQLLLRRGADPRSAAREGIPNAIELAQKNNKPEIAQLLQGGRITLHSSGGSPMACPSSSSPCSPELPPLN